MKKKGGYYRAAIGSPKRNLAGVNRWLEIIRGRSCKAAISLEAAA
jgi:hypothetical protein